MQLMIFNNFIAEIFPGVETAQIRVHWRWDVRHHEDDEHHDGGMWGPATAAARREARIVCEVQNAVYGAGSHWIEERDRPAFALPRPHLRRAFSARELMMSKCSPFSVGNFVDNSGTAL